MPQNAGEKLNRRQLAEQRRKLEEEQQQKRPKPEVDILDEQGTPLMGRKRVDPVDIEESAKSIQWPSKAQARPE